VGIPRNTESSSCGNAFPFSEERKNNFNEVELGLSEEVARKEARRCLKCGCSARFTCDLRKEASNHGIVYEEPIHDRPYIRKLMTILSS